MSENERKAFAEMLRYYISLNRLTQREFAEKIGVKESTVSMWCSGSREPKSVETLKDIARVLNVSVSDLLCESGSYYQDSEVRQLANFMHKNPEYKVLFDASKKVKPEDIEKVKTILEAFKE